MNTDPFLLLGIERTYEIDLEAIDAAWRLKSRECHPDRFVNAEPAFRAEAAARTTALNEARQILRDPLTRAAYLLRFTQEELLDGDVPRDFLSWVFAQQDALASARGQPAALMSLAETFDQCWTDALKNLGVAIDALKDGGDRQKAQTALMTCRFIRRLTETAQEELTKAAARA